MLCATKTLYRDLSIFPQQENGYCVSYVENGGRGGRRVVWKNTVGDFRGDKFRSVVSDKAYNGPLKLQATKLYMGYSSEKSPQ